MDRASWIGWLWMTDGHRHGGLVALASRWNRTAERIRAVPGACVLRRIREQASHRINGEQAGYRAAKGPRLAGIEQVVVVGVTNVEATTLHLRGRAIVVGVGNSRAGNRVVTAVVLLEGVRSIDGCRDRLGQIRGG